MHSYEKLIMQLFKKRGYLYAPLFLHFLKWDTWL
jgi:hypothetical protein